MTRILFVAVLAVLASALSPAASSAQDTTLRFAWPQGTEAHVRVTQVRDRVGTGRSQAILVEGEYDLALRSHPRGMLLDYSNYRTSRVAADPELPPGDPLRTLLERLGSLAPDDVVSREGELIEVGGVEEIARTVREVFQPLLDSAAGRPGAEEISEMMESLLSEEHLLVAARDQWQGQTGLWAGRTMQVGRPVRLDAELASPLAPDRMIPVTVELLLMGAVPCFEGAAEAGCVRLELTSRADPRGLATAFRAVLTRAGMPHSAPLPIERLTQETRVTVVAEPATLLPHTYVMTKVVTGNIRRGTVIRPFRQTEDTRVAYAFTSRR